MPDYLHSAVARSLELTRYIWGRQLNDRWLRNSALEKLCVVDKSSHRTKLSGLSRGNFKTVLLSQSSSLFESRPKTLALTL